MELRKTGKLAIQEPDRSSDETVIMSCDFVDRFLSRNFAKLGKCVGTNPGYFIIVPILLIVICVTGVQRMIYETEPSYLFAPMDGKSKSDRATIEELFPMNYSDNFHPGRMTRFGRFAHVIIVPKDNGSVLRSSIFEEIEFIDKSLKSMTIEYEDETYRYEDMCAKQYGKCFDNDLLDFSNRIKEIENQEYRLKYPIWLNTDYIKVFYLPINFGGVQTDSDGYITDAKAASLFYFFDITVKRGDIRAAIWEQKFLEFIDTIQVQNVHIAKFVSTSLRDELDSNTQLVLPFFSVTTFIMGAFSVITCLMADWVKSKPWLGVLACISAGLSVAGAFGLCMYAGVEMISINLAAPFLMLGVGMDDAFVLIASWRQTDCRLSIPDRLSKTYSDAAVSITITSLTNFISFVIGTITPFPSVRIFCIYTSACVLVCYFFAITFFGACMAYFGFAEKKNLHGLTLQPVIPKSTAVKQGKSWLYILCWTGGQDPDDPSNPVDSQDHYMMVLFRDKLAPTLCKPLVKFLVIIVFIIYLIIAIYGCYNVREGLERPNLSPSYSYAQNFYELDDKYFREYPHRIQIVFNQTMDYSDPAVQDRVEQIMTRFESSKFIAGPELTESWLRAYLKFAKNESSFIILQGLDLTTQDGFYTGLERFLRLPLTETIRDDINWSDDGSEIVASRFVIQSKNIENALMEKEMLLELRSIADEFPDDHISMFNYLFIFFDQFILVREISIQAIVVATLVMMAISIFFIPSFSCAIWVAFSIISIEIGVIGYMTHWGVNLDSISMINLIMCIGFSVDFSAHISYAYMSCSESTSEARVRSALYSLGLPIFQGSVSTILGIIALAFAPSYIFITFFKTVFLVMLFGALHGVFLLPVLLSLSDSCFGSSSSKSSKSSVATDRSSTDSGITISRLETYDEKDKDYSVYQIQVEPYQNLTPVTFDAVKRIRFTDSKLSNQKDATRFADYLVQPFSQEERYKSLPCSVTKQRTKEGLYISRISLQDHTCDEPNIVQFVVNDITVLQDSDSGQGSKASTSVPSSSASTTEDSDADARIELSAEEEEDECQSSPPHKR